MQACSCPGWLQHPQGACGGGLAGRPGIEPLHQPVLASSSCTCRWQSEHGQDLAVCQGESRGGFAPDTNSSCTCRWTAIMEPFPRKAPPSCPSQAPCSSPGLPRSLHSPSRRRLCPSRQTLHTSAATQALISRRPSRSTSPHGLRPQLTMARSVGPVPDSKERWALPKCLSAWHCAMHPHCLLNWALCACCMSCKLVMATHIIRAAYAAVPAWSDAAFLRLTLALCAGTRADQR